MQNIVVLAACLLSAVCQTEIKITSAAVTWGSGIDPKGAVPPALYEAEVHLVGGKLPVNPLFRVWRVKISDFPGLEQPGAKFPILGKDQGVEVQCSPGPNNTWRLHGIWPSAPEAGDRLIVGIYKKSVRLGWASSPLIEHPLPMLGKPPKSNLDIL